MGNLKEMGGCWGGRGVLCCTVDEGGGGCIEVAPVACCDRERCDVTEEDRCMDVCTGGREEGDGLYDPGIVFSASVPDDGPASALDWRGGDTLGSV